MGVILVSIIANNTVTSTQLSSVTDTVDISSLRTYTTQPAAEIANESIAFNSTANSLSVSTLSGVICTDFLVTNSTGGETITSGNYTATSACTITAVAASTYLNIADVNVSYNYTYHDPSGAINTTAILEADDVLTQAASATTWKTGDTACAISSIQLYNQTGDLMTVTTDYTWATDGNGNTGNLTLVNVGDLNTSISNSTTITYNYCPDNYLAASWQRTILNLVPGFFALAILIGAAFVILRILKNEGIVGNKDEF